MLKYKIPQIVTLTQFQAATGMTPAQYRNKVQELHKNR